ncbi:MAG TPA: lipopolysaccharide heptosyltransferase II [bacterium]|nr:lipopolysaccharide heptosyltransferase II [bacterium]
MSGPSRLILRVPNWLGDSLMATPAVARARELNPEAHLTVMARPAFAPFWKAFPGVDEVFILDSKRRHAGVLGFLRAAREIAAGRYDFALCLPQSFSSAFLFFAAQIPRRAGYAAEGRAPFLTHPLSLPDARKRHLVEEYVRLVEAAFGSPATSKPQALRAPLAAGKPEAAALLKKIGAAGKGLIALGPGATYGPAKRWPLAYWREVMKKLLASRGETLLLLGGAEEEAYLRPLVEDFRQGPQARRVHLLAGKTSVTGLVSLLSSCKLLITNDTGPMHAAAAAGTPTVALFGSTSPLWTRPFGRGHAVLYHPPRCSPCFQKTCPIGYVCLHRIQVAEVLAAAEKILRSKTRVGPEPLGGRT